MRLILQLCLMALILLGVGNRAWGKMAAGQNIAVRGFAQSEVFCSGGDEPPALESSGEAAAWGYDVASDVRDGPNVYAYVKQNPWSAWDPLGLSKRSDLDKEINHGHDRIGKLQEERTEIAKLHEEGKKLVNNDNRERMQKINEFWERRLKSLDSEIESTKKQLQDLTIEVIHVMIADENRDGDITGNESHHFNKLRSGSEEVTVTELPDGTVRFHGSNTVVVGQFVSPGQPQPMPRRVTNPKHHPNSRSPEPKNVDELFNKAIPDKSGVRWAKDQNGTFHRFSKPSNGETHWNGSTSGGEPIQLNNIPNEIIKVLGGR